MTKKLARIPSVFELAVGRHLVSFPYFVITAIFALFTHFLLSNDVLAGHVLERTAAVLAANAVLVVLLAGFYLLDRRLKTPMNRRAFVALFLLAGAMRGAAMEYLLSSAGLLAHPDYAYRIFVGAVNFGLSAWLFGVLLGVLGEFRRQSRRLISEREYLEHLQETVDGQISSNTEIEINAFREYLLTNLKLKHGDDATLVRQHLQHIISDVIRPVVEQMLNSRTAVVMSDLKPYGTKISGFNVLRNIRVADSIHPLIQGALPLLATAAASILIYGYPNGLYLILSLGLVWPALLLLARSLIAPRFERFNFKIRLLAIGVIFAVAITPSSLLAANMPASGSGSFVSGMGYLFAMFAGFGAAFWRAYTVELNRVYAQRSQYLRRIQWKIAEVNSRSWHQQLHFARRVHGSLQSEVAALAIKLDREIAKGNADEAALAELRTKLEDRVRVVFDAPEPITDLGAILTEIAETWEGVCQISVSLTDGDAAEILKDQIAVETTLEVVREGISNAVRHGKAKNVEISVAIIGPDVIRVRVANDGSPVDPETIATGRSGLGSMHLQDCAIEYSIGPTENRTVLLADLPFRG